MDWLSARICAYARRWLPMPRGGAASTTAHAAGAAAAPTRACRLRARGVRRSADTASAAGPGVPADACLVHARPQQGVADRPRLAASGARHPRCPAGGLRQARHRRAFPADPGPLSPTGTGPRPCSIRTAPQRAAPIAAATAKNHRMPPLSLCPSCSQGRDVRRCSRRLELSDHGAPSAACSGSVLIGLSLPVAARPGGRRGRGHHGGRARRGRGARHQGRMFGSASTTCCSPAASAIMRRRSQGDPGQVHRGADA